MLKSVQRERWGRDKFIKWITLNRGNKRGSHLRYFVNLFSCRSTSSYWFLAVNNKNNNNSESRYRSRDDLPFLLGEPCYCFRLNVAFSSFKPVIDTNRTRMKRVKHAKQ